VISNLALIQIPCLLDRGFSTTTGTLARKLRLRYSIHHSKYKNRMHKDPYFHHVGIEIMIPWQYH
jgi:hypothetical protein